MTTATTVVLLAQFCYGDPIISAAAPSSGATAVVGLEGDLVGAEVTAEGLISADGLVVADDGQHIADGLATAGAQLTAHLHGQSGNAPSSGESLAVEGGDGRSRPRTPLLDRYTFLETVRTEIEEDRLPELPDFLESIGLGHRLEVRTVRHDERDAVLHLRRCSGLSVLPQGTL